jgi:hypothetical protein
MMGGRTGDGQMERVPRGVWADLRVLPAFVMDSILEAAFPVLAFHGLHVQHFGFVEQLMMEAEDLFVFPVRRLRCGRGRHLLCLVCPDSGRDGAGVDGAARQAGADGHAEGHGCRVPARGAREAAR